MGNVSDVESADKVGVVRLDEAETISETSMERGSEL
jgi:hypothetical protein